MSVRLRCWGVKWLALDENGYAILKIVPHTINMWLDESCVGMHCSSPMLHSVAGHLRRVTQPNCLRAMKFLEWSTNYFVVFFLGSWVSWHKVFCALFISFFIYVWNYGLPWDASHYLAPYQTHSLRSSVDCIYFQHVCIHKLSWPMQEIGNFFSRSLLLYLHKRRGCMPLVTLTIPAW